MESSLHNPAQPNDVSKNELGNLRVLLAEDNEINQFLINTILEGWNFTVDTVENGLLALEHLSQHQYDVVLMDIQMPEMGGYETITRIRASDTSISSIPIIALTAHTPGETAKCLSVGADAYLSKPFEPEDLYKLLQLHVKRTT